MIFREPTEGGTTVRKRVALRCEMLEIPPSQFPYNRTRKEQKIRKKKKLKENQVVFRRSSICGGSQKIKEEKRK